ncbi:chromosomal replication initiator protein DnaA [Glycomyces buryatensis]|uniref:chromosomal replication initiator protein DnaA n=1 Tax=Glycomyces buryatensis TaxID=2570927 RepID=UPI002482A0B3|nr:chromosomal replication initiator protein DnaA [Glycomyces buryatensis]
MTDQDLSAVWSAVTAELTETSVLSRQQQAWMRLTQPLVAMNGTFIIAAPNKFARAAFESKLRDPISESLSQVLGQPTQIAVTMQDSSTEAPIEHATAAAPEPPAEPVRAEEPPAPVRRDESWEPARPAASDATLIFEMPRTDPVETPPSPPAPRSQPPAQAEPQYQEPAPASPQQPQAQPQQRQPDPVPVQPSANPPSLFDTDAFRANGRGSRARTAAETQTEARMTESRTEVQPETAPERPVSPAPVAAPAPEAPSIPQQQPHQPEVAEPTPAHAVAAEANAYTPPVAPPPSDDPDPQRRGGITKSVKEAPQAGVVDGVGRLQPRYNFDTFVIGSSNRFAHAAAFAVAEAPAKAYNPLFIYGGSGLGKTHLLHAVGHYAHDLGTASSVRYVTTEEFTNDFINSLSDRRQQAFQRRYRDVDILLIDDIQFLMDRERTQEEFFHTFNALHNANKQLVISSDRSPKQLQTLEDRLRTRFEWGLLADIQPPDLETRIAILRKKAVQDELNIPTDAVEFIATQIHHSIRELEGALIRVTAYASLNRKPVDLGLAEEVLHDFIPEGGQAAEVTVDQIMSATADYFGVQGSDLKGNSRSRVLVNARQVAMYLCRELTDMSLPRIGQAFGGRDHTTVMHANKKIRKQMAERRALYNQIAELTNRLKHTDE